MPYQLKNFDWYALKLGYKPVLTLEYSSEGFAEFSPHIEGIKKEGFVVHSRDLAAEPLRAGGVRKHTLSAARSRYQVFIGRRRANIKGILAAYAANDMGEVGRFLGYPECCVREYAERIKSEKGLRPPYLSVRNNLLAAAVPGTARRLSPANNFLLHYDGRVLNSKAMADARFRRIFFGLFPYSLTDHCPCTAACAATERRGKKVFEAIRADDPGWADRALELAGNPVLYLDDFRFFILKGEPAGAGRVDYSAVLFSSEGEAAGLGKALAAGDSVTARDGRLEVRRAGRLLSRGGSLRAVPRVLPFRGWSAGGK